MKCTKGLIAAVAFVLAILWAPGIQAGCVQCTVIGHCFNCTATEGSGGNSCPNVSCQSCTVWGTCNGGGGCFVGTTLISTPAGLLAIKDLAFGDLVITQDKEGNLRTAPVVQTHISESLSYLVINGDLKVTSTHPFYVEGEWVNAGDLQSGDRLATQSGELITVSSIELVHRGVRVYNISVSGDETFFANGYFVHNKPPAIGG